MVYKIVGLKYKIHIFKKVWHSYPKYDIHTQGMSVIPTFGMIPAVKTSYQFWYEYHTSVFAV